jgi:hypothetical protein
LSTRMSTAVGPVTSADSGAGRPGTSACQFGIVAKFDKEVVSAQPMARRPLSINFGLTGHESRSHGLNLHETTRFRGYVPPPQQHRKPA